jgi:hypothetical protein
MIDRGLNQKQLSEEMNKRGIKTSEYSLSYKINKKSAFKEDEIKIISLILGVCPCEIFFDLEFLNKEHVAS